MTKSSGSGTSHVASKSVVFNDTGAGTLSVASGTLSMEGTANLGSSGAVSIAADAVLSFNSGTASFADGASFAGAGTLAVVNSAIVSLPSGSVTVNTPLTLAGARSRGRAISFSPQPPR